MQLKNPRERIKDESFDKDNCCGQAQDRNWIALQNSKVDASTNGDKKQAKQKTFEGFNVCFKFVPELGVRQNHARKECTKGG